MANVKWSQFPSVTPGNSDEVVGLHAGDNARFSIANIVAAVRNGLANIFVPKTDVGAAGGVASLDNTGKVPTSQLPPIASTAADVTYDNTGSGLAATNVQDAIDEVYGDIPAQASDIGAQDTITANGILKGDGAGSVSAATAGTDYQIPLTAGTDYATPTQLDSKANQSQLAYVETGTTASRNYNAGEYICWNGLTYTANQAISSGTTLSAGTGGNLTECVGGGLNDFKGGFGLKTSALTGVAAGTATNIIYYNDYFVQILFTSAGKTWNDGDTIGTIPSELRPPYEIKGVATSYNPMTAFQITIPPGTGIMATENRTSVTSRISFNVIYLR